MHTTSAGLHHITAIAADTPRSLAFYRDVLMLRLVKRTVNFDDPATSHLYYGDAGGHPGTILTFFTWPSAAAHRIGSGQASEVAFRIPETSVAAWLPRLVERSVPHEMTRRFGRTAITLRDPDGLELALVASPDPPPAPRDDATAILGLDGVTLWLRDIEPTAALLGEVLGYREIAREGDVVRFETGSGIGNVVDLKAAGTAPLGRLGRGGVHHVAFRVADTNAQADLSACLRARGLTVTDPIDRLYFRSVYVREPGGVLFEIATDAPGFTVDEPAEHLGEALKLPPKLEAHRAEIEARLR
ncbi:ring-cleaving dioxygenase [Blastochloris viridis]|uniref:Glyoxalase family protein n=1 Tax=Blastochloris viridis TaxID=1079 RepID=A0A0H5BK49_BLAVI|nr:ring-cleaving dioxygenase [Blastochloris viridis]ALK09196.1 Putative ring-cleaving dioxygenase MhqO [Blastochloris viridis]BAS00937.1 glyoxalase family protein [Blastochloris viridis]CUU41859.1 Putative ring-cleaving dioxygenase mhqO [Blastochloris viridis]